MEVVAACRAPWGACGQHCVECAARRQKGGKRVRCLGRGEGSRPGENSSDHEKSRSWEREGRGVQKGRAVGGSGIEALLL